MHTLIPRKPSRRIFLILITALAIGYTGLVFTGSRFNIIPQLVAKTDTAAASAFPEISGTELSASQLKVIDILKQEFEAQQEGTKYSQGIEEAWCADFVSWVYNEAGMPLKNPNSGSWRIPGTFTLREYYEAEDRFMPADSTYVPKVGDIMLYDNPSPFGQHTNFVIKNESGIITTIGGNEPGGIRVVKHTKPDDAGFLGYGVFGEEQR